ncbi:MAG: hypothetical protein HON90_14010, partial [Halobacteriovoraceae bacterium]|nr:hypothetical protein [Halobacteriovoraceae bacterium]
MKKCLGDKINQLNLFLGVSMLFDWKNSQVFERSSNLYSFSRNPLFKVNKLLHIYMPWAQDFDAELMFKVKANINEGGSSFIPYMEIDQSAKTFSAVEMKVLNDQIAS